MGYPDGIDEKKRKLSIKAMDVLNKKKHGLVQMLMDVLNKKKSFRKFTCHFWPGSLRHEKLFLTGKAHHFLQRFQRLQTFNVYGLNDHISEVENVLQWERQRCTSQLWICPYRLTHCFLLSFPFLEIIFLFVQWILDPIMLCNVPRLNFFKCSMDIETPYVTNPYDLIHFSRCSSPFSSCQCFWSLVYFEFWH